MKFKNEDFVCGCVIAFSDDRSEGKMIYECNACKEENNNEDNAC